MRARPARTRGGIEHHARAARVLGREESDQTCVCLHECAKAIDTDISMRGMHPISSGGSPAQRKEFNGARAMMVSPIQTPEITTAEAMSANRLCQITSLAGALHGRRADVAWYCASVLA